jgi:hypothetical protein
VIPTSPSPSACRSAASKLKRCTTTPTRPCGDPCGHQHQTHLPSRTSREPPHYWQENQAQRYWQRPTAEWPLQGTSRGITRQVHRQRHGPCNSSPRCIARVDLPRGEHCSSRTHDRCQCDQTERRGPCRDEAADHLSNAVFTNLLPLNALTPPLTRENQGRLAPQSRGRFLGP